MFPSHNIKIVIVHGKITEKIRKMNIKIYTKGEALAIYHHATPLKRNYVQRFSYDFVLALVLKIEINDVINIL